MRAVLVRDADDEAGPARVARHDEPVAYACVHVTHLLHVSRFRGS
ncbi:MAG: hypothetical protein ACRDOK_13290 [Streptosporangiaceae bacterium]